MCLMPGSLGKAIFFTFLKHRILWTYVELSIKYWIAFLVFCQSTHFYTYTWQFVTCKYWIAPHTLIFHILGQGFDILMGMQFQRVLSYRILIYVRYFVIDSAYIRLCLCHYNDVILGAIAFQITSLAVVYSCVYSGADERKYQRSASLAFVLGIHRWPVNSPHKWPVTRKMLQFDGVIMANCTPCTWMDNSFEAVYT